MTKALKSVESHSDFIGHIDSQTVHGMGYSLGGATILLAAGAGFSSERLAQQCNEHQRNDATYCEDPGKLFRLMQYFRHDVSLPDTADPFRNLPLIYGKVVLVASAYQGLDLTPPLSLTKLMIIAIEGDTIVKPKFHARPLFEAACRQIPCDYQTVPGHHYAFIAPFPKWLTDEEDIPVAKDPEGFDRPEFMKTLNTIILNFMVNYLGLVQK